jgi:hypothetical protein
VITNQPASQVIAVGGATTLTVGVSNGLAPYSYQWKLNGNNVGASSSAYPISNAQASNAGAYTVVVKDSLGQLVTSAEADITVGTLGTGTGLLGYYYNIDLFSTDTPPNPFIGPPTVAEIDPTVNFNLATGVNLPSGAATYVTARWQGQVQPLYSQTYTFYTTSDDGSRVWVNGQLVVDSWHSQSPTQRSGTIALTAGQKYYLVMEYFQRTGGAVAELSWSSPNQFMEIIPMTQLYPASSALVPVLSTGVSNGTNLVLNWVGTMTLLSAPQVTGPWTPIITNVAPVTINMKSSPQMFYLLENQD